MYLLCFYFQICPDHAKFRNGPPPNLEQQDVMFRKAYVTGESAAIAGQETGESTPILVDDDRDGGSKITGGNASLVLERRKKRALFSRYTTRH
jgi:hypothetical protein